MPISQINRSLKTHKATDLTSTLPSSQNQSTPVIKVWTWARVFDEHRFPNG